MAKDDARAQEPAPDELEALVRKTEGIQPWRRVFHGGGGVLMAVTGHMLGPDSPGLRLLLGAAVLLAFAGDAVRLRRRDANAVFFGWFRQLASPREAGRVASSTWYVTGALGVSLAAPEFFVPSILVLALADPAASVVGRTWGRHRLGKGSWEGTTAFMLVASAVLIPFVGVPTGLLVALAASVAEVLPVPVDDNLTTPAAVALALSVAAMAA